MTARPLNAALRRLAAWPIDRPRAVLTVAAVLAVLAALSTARIQRSNSLHDLLGDRSGAATALQRVMESFPAVDELLVLVTDDDRTARPEPDESAARLLAFARDFEAAVDASPEARAMCSRIRHALDPEMLDFVRDQVVLAALYYLDDEQFRALQERLTLPAMKEQIRQNEVMIAAPGPAAGALAHALLRDPLRLREFLAERIGPPRTTVGTWRSGPDFISPDGRSLLIRVSGVRPGTDLAFCSRFTAGIRGILDGVPAPGLRAELAGPYAIAATSAASIRADAISNIVWAVVLMQVLFLFSYRSVWAFPLAIIPVGVGILVSFGLFALLGHRITPLTAVIAAMLAGLGIDYSIHYLSHYDSVRAHTPDPREGARRTLSEIALPLFAAGITSVHGFVAIAISGARALRDFALLGAAGLALSLLASVLVLPALLRVAEPGHTPDAPGLRPAAARFSFRFMIDALSRRPRLWITISGSVLAAMTVVAMLHPVPPLETDLSAMHPRPNPPLRTQERIGRLFGGVADPLLVNYAADSADELLTRAHAIDRALSSPDAGAIGVSATFGLASVLPDPASRQLGASRAARLDPDRIAADFFAALEDSIFDPTSYREYTDFLRSLASAREPPGLASLERFRSLTSAFIADAGPGANRGAPRYQSVTYVFFDRSLDDRARRDSAVLTIRDLLAAVPGATLTGVTVVAYDVERMIRRDIPRVVAICAAAVLLTVIVLFRRPADVALILIPVWWSVAAVLAYMALAGERINLANLVAMPLLLGICVDYGIFAVGLARAARQEHRARRESAEGLLKRLGATGHAMLMTSTTTIIGFGTLIATSTPAIRSLGRLVGVGVCACLLGTVFLLMPILILLHRRPAGPPRTGA